MIKIKIFNFNIGVKTSVFEFKNVLNVLNLLVKTWLRLRMSEVTLTELIILYILYKDIIVNIEELIGFLKKKINIKLLLKLIFLNNELS